VIDIAKTASPAPKRDSRLVIVLLAALAFIVWDSGWLMKFVPDRERDQVDGEVENVLIIKKLDGMTVEQAQVAASPVPDEICDQRGIGYRAVWQDTDIKNADEWVRQLFGFYRDEAPCLATIDKHGNRKKHELPSSISEFRQLVGAR